MSSLSDNELRALGFKPYRKTALAWMKQMPEPFTVETLEGVMQGKAGDYLCIGVNGEQWPLDQEIFKKSYVPVDD